jgi:hypothetical protein
VPSAAAASPTPALAAAAFSSRLLARSVRGVEPWASELRPTISGAAAVSKWGGASAGRAGRRPSLLVDEAEAVGGAVARLGGGVQLAEALAA